MPTPTKTPGVVLAPEPGSLSIAVKLDRDTETTPIQARRFAEYIVAASSDYALGEGGRTGYEITLYQQTREAEATEEDRELYTVVPGGCVLFAQVGWRGIEQWDTTPERVEEFAHALLATVAAARKRGLFR